MIEAVIDSDIGEIRELIAQAVRTSVVSCEDEAETLIENIGSEVDRCLSDSTLFSEHL